ncbi:MAG: hypothetical protein MUC76_00855 [Spirochaetes bacterium]|nr:hypothetical protein [Spirochaetota bacterium]
MRESTRFVLYLGAALCVLYLGLRYIIPFILKVLVGILGVLVHAAIILLVAIGILWLFTHLVKTIRS